MTMSEGQEFICLSEAIYRVDYNLLSDTCSMTSTDCLVLRFALYPIDECITIQYFLGTAVATCCGGHERNMNVICPQPMRQVKHECDLSPTYETSEACM